MRTLKLIAVLILLPLCLGLFGVWELQRSTESIRDFAEAKAELGVMRPEIEAMVAKPFSRSAKVDINGERMGVHQALSLITQAEHELTILQPVAAVMNNLAKGVIALGLLASLVGVLGLSGLRWAGARASHSRERLLHTFSRVSRLLPYLLVGHIVAMGAAVAAILGFEGLGLWHMGKMATGEFKLMLIVLMLMLGFLYSIWQMGKQLPVMLRMFQSTPMSVLGQVVTPQQAPALWACVRELADQLGALAPEHIVLGMTEGFYVTSSDVNLLPSGTALKGRTLHLPMMYLGLLDSAETGAVIGHELAHFAGADTEYSLRFVPIYEGIGRSLGVIAETMLQSDLLQRTTLWPAFMLGEYFMERFDHAVSHWSRVRELAADAAGAQLTGNIAIASALVRISAIDPLLHQGVSTHVVRATNPSAEHVLTRDLPGSVLQELTAQPLTLPEEEMAASLPHPSDTHPSNRERLASLQVTVEEAVSRGTRPIIAAQASAAMDHYFADPQALRARITEDFLGHYVEQDAAVVQALRSHAGNATEEVRLHEGARLRGWITLGCFSLFMLLGLGLLILPYLLPQVFVDADSTMKLVGILLLISMAFLLPLSLRMLTRANKTALLLTPEHFVFANFKAPLPIQHVADFGLQVGHGVHLNLLLEDDAPMPELASRSFFSPDAKLDKKKRWVQLQLLQICRDDKKLKDQELADLIGTYLNAGTARHLLQQRFEQA
ncbi:Zn-dependent protease with chaperone function [Pseudomonas sp. GM74]|uniref:M48 family metallopeptidase n=1 Tax=Pseudomonas sp. GM74 TaxID=1144336 RepID=UPI0002705B5A|nr:M48 family metallopeptidase [Pseudomonas sp. GM74]EJM87864.1 Zn-dependent protease with chaperone function [Pseudomonas sp. GM74]